MKLTTVKEIYKNREEYLNREVTVGGWVRSVRGSKAFGFIVLHDGTFLDTAGCISRQYAEFCRDQQAECRRCYYRQGNSGSDTGSKTAV